MTWTKTRAAIQLRYLVSRLTVAPLVIQEPTSVVPTTRSGGYFAGLWVVAWILDGTTERWGWYQALSLKEAPGEAPDATSQDCVLLLGAITFISPRDIRGGNSFPLSDLLSVRIAGRAMIDDLDDQLHPITKLCRLLSS